MNAFDVILVLIVVVSTIAGLAKGLVREVFSLAGVLLGILLALIFGPGLSLFLERWIPYESAAYAAAFVLVFLLTMVAAALVAALVTKVLSVANLGFYNRLLGGAFGFVRGAVIGLVLILGLTLFLDADSPLVRESRLTPQLAWGARGLAPLLPETIRGVLLDRLDRLSEPAGADAEDVTI
jgi:membrane protein required for colicin V production